MAAGTTSLNIGWSRLVNTTIRDFVRGEELNILRNRKLPALMKKRGRITYGHGGTAMDWKVRYRRAPMIGFADGDTINFSRQDRHKTAALDWRGYSLSDAMTKGEYLQNRGPEAIIKLFDTRTRMLLEDAEDQFSEQFYVDGTMPQNVKYMYGIESFLNYATQQVGNGAMLPSGNYAGLNCALGAYGGSWSVPTSGNLTWPSGHGDASYDFWSPLIVDVGDTYFGTGTPYWGINGTNPVSCVEAISFSIIKSKKSPSKKGSLDLFILNDAGYEQYIQNLRSIQRIVVTNQASELIGLGFDDVVQQDGGKDVCWEYGIPTASQLNNAKGVIGYGLNVDQLELCSQQDEVWVPEGPSFDDASKTWRWSIDCFVQLKSNPKYQCKILNFSTPTDSAQM